MILNRLKEQKEFYAKIPKKASKKIEKTIEEVKQKLTKIRKEDVLKAKAIKVSKKRRKQRNKYLERQEQIKRQKQLQDSHHSPPEFSWDRENPETQ